MINAAAAAASNAAAAEKHASNTDHWLVAIIAVLACLIFALILIGVFVYMRNRRRPPPLIIDAGLGHVNPSDNPYDIGSSLMREVIPPPPRPKNPFHGHLPADLPLDMFSPLKVAFFSKRHEVVSTTSSFGNLDVEAKVGSPL